MGERSYTGAAITDVGEMSERLEKSKGTKMYPAVTDNGERAEYFRNLIGDAIEQLETAFPEFRKPSDNAVTGCRVNLSSVDDVAGAAWRFLSGCQRAARNPTFALFCVLGLGYSRQAVYDVIRRRRDRATEFLEVFQSLCAGLTEAASLDRKVDVASAIFSLKNSGAGYADRVTIDSDTNKVDVYQSGDPEEIARRYLADMVQSIELKGEK